MTLAIAIPAPALAAAALPMVVALTVFFADRVRVPVALIELCPEILAIAELVIVELATAASTAVLMYELIPPAVAFPSTEEIPEMTTLPVLSMRVSTRETVAVEPNVAFATTGSIDIVAPDTVAGTVTTDIVAVILEVALRVIFPAFRVAPVKFTCALLVALSGVVSGINVGA